MKKKQLKSLQKILDEGDYSGTKFDRLLDLQVEIDGKWVTIELNKGEKEALGNRQIEIAEMVIERVLEEANGGAE
jgi:ribosomal protein L16/L10AE